MKQKKRLPVAEMIKQIEADPEFIARQAQAPPELRAHWEALRRAEVPLVADLRNAGFEVDSVWDLVNSRAPRPAAVPILFDHFSRDYPPRIREGIARALADRVTRLRWDELVGLYRAESETHAKDGLAATILSIMTPEVLDEVIALASDPANGESRIFLVYGIGRMRDPRTEDALFALVDDPVVEKEARARLDARRKSAERRLKRRREKRLH